MNELDAVAVVDKQRQFFDRGVTRSVEYRHEQLRRLKDALKAYESKILEAVWSDLRKSYFESYTAELGLCYEEIKHTLKNLKKWSRPRRVTTPLVLFHSKCWTQASPRGTALIIGPWNYPVQLIISPLIGAIAAGCTAVIKVSEMAPATGKVLAAMLGEYFPEDYVKVIQGGVPETTSLLKQRFDHIFFTGSTNVGRIVMRAAAEHLTSITLELGGKSPVIVDKTADIPTVAKRLVWMKLYNAGQTCIGPDYLLVEPAVKDQLVQAIGEQIKAMYGADLQASTDLPRIINEGHFDRLVKLMEGGKVILGGEHDRSDKYVAPTLLDDVDMNSPLMREEIFGPLLPIVPIANLDEAIAIIKERPNPLALYLFSKNQSAEHRILNEVQFGCAVINNGLINMINPHLPFGGVGESGMGAYHGKESFEAFSHRKSILKSYIFPGGGLIYPPFGKRFNLLRKVLK